jgi:hypothetical protein
MNIRKILAIAVILVVLGTSYALAGPTVGGLWNSMMGSDIAGNGMMNHGNGMCGDYASSDINANPITIEKAKEEVEQYLWDAQREREHALSLVSQLAR